MACDHASRGFFEGVRKEAFLGGTMQELIDKVQELVAFELERANTIHPPKFNSYHEAYKEEILSGVQSRGIGKGR